MSEQKNNSDFKAKNMAEVTAGTRSACSGGNSRLSSWNGFNIGNDDFKFHDTYIIHISKFIITRDHTLLISNPFSLQRPFGSLLLDIFLFNLYITTNRDSTLLRTVIFIAFTYWGWIKMSLAKKCRLLWTYTGFVFNRVETKKEAVYYTSAKISISVLIFKRIKGGRDENVSKLPFNEL